MIVERFGELGEFWKEIGFGSFNPPETEGGIWNDTKEYLKFLGEAATYAPTPASATLRVGKAANWLLVKSGLGRKLLGRLEIGVGKYIGKPYSGVRNERRTGILFAVNTVYALQKAALAAEEVYARHGLDNEEAARAGGKEKYGQEISVFMTAF